jgi:hypothetical protein
VLTASILLATTRIPADAPPGRYTISSDIAFDTKTMLAWQRSIPTGLVTWDSARTYCTALSLLGSGWRLPTVKELLTIVDVTRQNPTIDLRAFPGTPATAPNAGEDWGPFWTSTEVAGDPSLTMWVVNFYNGYPIAGSYGLKSALNYVRCVR